MNTNETNPINVFVVNYMADALGVNIGDVPEETIEKLCDYLGVIYGYPHYEIPLHRALKWSAPRCSSCPTPKGCQLLEKVR